MALVNETSSHWEGGGGVIQHQDLNVLPVERAANASTATLTVVPPQAPFPKLFLKSGEDKPPYLKENHI